MNTTSQKVKLFNTIGALSVALAIFVQLGFVTVSTVSCFACDDKASISELNSCCSAKTEVDSDACSVNDGCCSSHQFNYTFYKKSASNDQVSFESDIQNCEIPVNELISLSFFHSRIAGLFANAPPWSGSGIQLLLNICKMTV